MVTPSATPSKTATHQFASLTFGVFLTYLTIGLPLPVLPLFIFHDLGMDNMWVGIVIGSQFFVTVFTRSLAGRFADEHGGKRSAVLGILSCALSGLSIVLAAVLPVSVTLKLIILIIGRFILGLGESQLISGNFVWGLSLLGPARSGQVMSWNGMAIYGSLGVGAPLGLLIYQQYGLLPLGILIFVLPLAALLCNFWIASSPPLKGARLPFSQIVGFIWLPGLALALQGTGFAVIGAFISLFFQEQGWQYAGLTLSCFGGAYVLMRVFFGHLPDKIGGVKVACISLLVETLGLLLLWQSSSAVMALSGATLTGMGCSLIFPSLGVEVVRRVPEQVRGTAAAGYAAFQDISYAFTSPIAGIVIGLCGYASVFALSAMCALLGMCVVLYYARRIRQP